MKLKKYDEKCVRITTVDDEIFEGACLYFDKEFSGEEYGKADECLNISNWLFYPDYIRKIEVIDEDHPFLADYGRIEEEIVADGYDYIVDAFYSQMPVNVYRLLRYIEDHKDLISEKERLCKDLNGVIDYYDDEKVKQICGKLIREFE